MQAYIANRKEFCISNTAEQGARIICTQSKKGVVSWRWNCRKMGYGSPVSFPFRSLENQDLVHFQESSGCWWVVVQKVCWGDTPLRSSTFQKFSRWCFLWKFRSHLEMSIRFVLVFKWFLNVKFVLIEFALFLQVMHLHLFSEISLCAGFRMRTIFGHCAFKGKTRKRQIWSPRRSS